MLHHEPVSSASSSSATGGRYAPHPAAMSSDTWPISLDEMTQQLKSRKPNSVMGQSPYDSKVEAAAGAAALVNSAFAARAAPGSSAPIAATPRNASLPTRAPPNMGASPPTRQWSAGWEQKASIRAPPPAPLSINTAPKRKAESPKFELPMVVLHPPDDEAGDPIPLYPRPSPERAFFAPPSPNQRIIDSAPIPLPKEEAPPAIKAAAAAAQTSPVVVRGFNAKTAAPAARAANGFDEEWESMMEAMPQKKQSNGQKSVLYPARRAPAPPSSDTPTSAIVSNGNSQLPLDDAPRAPEMTDAAKSKAGPSKQQVMAVNDAPTPPEPKKTRRRSLSLSAIFSKKKRNADLPSDIPPVPALPTKTAVPASAPASRPETPSSETEKKAKRRRSFKDLFTKSSSQEPGQPKVRRSQSKPELRKARFPAEDAPPMPSLPPMQVASGPAPTPTTHVPDALAALTARSSSGKQPPVEFVPDVFAAFGSNSANNIGSVERARAAAPPPAPPVPAGPPPSSAASASGKQNKYVIPPLHEVGAPPVPEKTEEPTKRKSLGKRLSLSSLSAAFKKKKPETNAPDVPALPAGYERAGPHGRSHTPTNERPGRSHTPTNERPGPSHTPTQERATKSAPTTPKMSSKKALAEDVPPMPQPAAVPTTGHKSRPSLPWQQDEVEQEQTQELPSRKESTQAFPDRPAQEKQFPSQASQAMPQLQKKQPSRQLAQQAAQQAAQQSAKQPSQATVQPVSSPSPSQEAEPRVRKVSKSSQSSQSELPLKVVAIKPPSPTKPLNIQKRVPVPSVNGSPKTKSAEALDSPSTPPVAPIVTVGAAAVGAAAAGAAIAAASSSRGASPRVRALPEPPKTVMPQTGEPQTVETPKTVGKRMSRPLPAHPVVTKASLPHLRQASEESTTLAYLDGDSEDAHANGSVQSHASNSTIMPSFTPQRSGPPASLVTDSPIKPNDGMEPDPPSPSPSMMMAAEVHTAQTARRSKFRSLSYSTEILTLADEQGPSLHELRNIVTRGENSGVAAASAALVGASVPAAPKEKPAVDAHVLSAKDADETRSNRNAAVLAAPVDRELPSVIDFTATPEATPPTIAQAVTEEPEELEDDLPEGWTRVTQPSSNQYSRTKAASDDLHDPIPHVAGIVPGSAPASLSRASAPIITPLASAPSVKDAIASTSLGLPPPQISPLEEAMEEAREAMDTASSYFSSAANRMSRVATGWVPAGWASVVTQRLSPSNTNTELPETTTPRSPNSELPPVHYQSPSVESTATFESAEEGSLDSATFETFDTSETYTPSRAARSYTPTLPPPQSDLVTASQLPARNRRGSMPASLAATVARRRFISTPSGGDIDAEEHLGEDLPHIPLTFEASVVDGFKTPVRRPYTGRSSTVPNTPTGTTAPTLASLLTAEPQDMEILDLQPPSASSDSRPDSPLDLQMPGMFFPIENSPFVVPFPPGEEATSVTNSPRSPTAVIHYTPTAAARERTRRDSGITSAVGGFGFARQGPIDNVDGVTVSNTPTRNNPVQYDSVVRHSLPTVVDYSRSARSSRASLGPEYAMWADVANSNIDTVQEAEESFQLDSSSSHSSGSDELDAAPCTPRTPDLDALTGVTPPSAARGKNSTPASSDSTPSKSPAGRAPGAGFRAMHYDMSQSSDEANESFATAQDVPL